MNAGYNSKPIRFFHVGDSGKFFKTRKSMKEVDVCPICLEQFAGAEDVYLVISNQAGIPNRILHTSCVKNEDETIIRLASLYKTAKEMKKQFGDWF